MKVLFWGTPEFALPSLGALLGEGHDVIGVVTQPDRPRGRGRALTPSPVKEFAQSEMIPVLQPERARDGAFADEVRALAPDLNVVVAYGQILSRELLDAPARGSLNVHASLLPALRGAAPINWAIIRGHTKTGVTVMRMVEELDAGPMLMRAEEPILPEETATDLAVRLSEVGAATLVEVLALMEFGEGPAETPQDDAAATYAPRLTRDDARIDWSLPADKVADLIRGLDAVPGAWTRHRGEVLKLYRPLRAEGDSTAGPGAPEGAEAADAATSTRAVAAGSAPGTILEASPREAEGLLVACGEGALWLREVKPAGKRRMTAAEWVRGRGAQSGDRLDG